VIALLAVGKFAGTSLAVALDQGFVAPFLYMGAFSAVREMSPEVTLSQLVNRTTTRWKHDVPPALPTMWAIWIPAQIGNYAFVPKALSVPYINAIGLVWGVFMSMIMIEPTGSSLHATTGSNKHHICGSASDGAFHGA